MRTFTAILLASAGLFAQPALAADDAAAAADSADAGGTDIIVFGQGETRQVQEIQSRDIAILAPGSSPLKAIEKLPSVNVQSADAFGNYEWSTRVTIRSFSQNQLGFTFDGIPLGDMSYGNHNGLHISRIVSPENIGSVRVSQGAGAIGTQSTSNLGGTVETFSMDPARELAGDVEGTLGTEDSVRGFARINVGSDTGPRGFVSYAYGVTDKFKGNGKQDQHMVNAKLVVPAGDGAFDAWFSFSDRREQDYQDMSLGMIARLGYHSDNTAPDYAFAVRLADIGNNRGDTGAPVSNAAAGKVYPGNITSVDDMYYDASGLRQDTVAALGYKTPIGDAAHVAIKGYYHHNKGMGLWGTPYVPSPTGSPLSIRTTEYDIDRYGLFGSADVKIAFNTITVGGWFEHNDFNQARRFYAFDSRQNPGRGFRTFPTDPFATQWEFDFTTKTLQYYVEDDIALGALKVNLGWKGFKVTNQADAIVQATFPEGRIKAQDWFQPHAGLTYDVTDKAQLFAGFTQSTRAFASATTTGPFSTTQAGFDAIRNRLRPESSDTYELGLRYNDPVFNGVVGAYLVNFKNRLLAVSSGPGIIGSPSVLQNVGSVRAAGLEAAGDLRVGGGVSLYASYSYTDSTYRDDVVDGVGKVTRIKGKTVVDSPKHLLRGEISYDKGAFFGRIAANFMSKRFFTYTNDQSVPSRLLVDAAVGYRFSDRIEVQLNGVNLTDKKYVSTIGSNGFGNSGDAQTLLIGSPLEVFASIKVGL